MTKWSPWIIDNGFIYKKYNSNKIEIKRVDNDSYQLTLCGQEIIPYIDLYRKFYNQWYFYNMEDAMIFVNGFLIKADKLIAFL